MSEHRIPAIDRAVEILDALAAASPLSIRDVAARTRLARSTVYRTLNTLEAHGLVRRSGSDGYVLGVRLLRLARSVPQGVDLITLARPVLDDLAAQVGGSAKLSIVDGRDALVVAVAESPGAYSVTTQVGRRFPLHAGAASKLLLAYLSADGQREILTARLPAVTTRTITDPTTLAMALARIRELGYAEDEGEFVDGIRAVAAPILDGFGVCLGAISVPFLATTDPMRAAVIRDHVIAAARGLTNKTTA